MNKRAAVSAFVLAAATTIGAWATEDPQFDQGVQAPAVSLAATSRAPSGGTVWVSVDPKDIATLKASGLQIGSAVEQNKNAAIYQVTPDLLPRISKIMHEKFHRCAGYMTFRTKQEAESALSAGGASAAETYTIDQGAWLAPVLPQVAEENIRGTIEALAGFNNRYYTSDTGVEAAHWLQSRWQALAKDIPGASVSLVTHAGWKQPSVVLTIPGSEQPDEYVILGGHLDSINLEDWGRGEAAAPGADDNASGIAVLSEAIRVLAKSGFRPKRTVQFMGYAAEEVGLRGSQDIAASYAGRKVIGVIQYDMTNFPGAGDQVYFINDNVDSNLTAFLGKLVEAYAGVKWGTMECGYACSDHASWTRNGFPASAAFEATMETMDHNLHTDHDTLANGGGDASHSVPFAKLAVAFAVELAKVSGSGKSAAQLVPAGGHPSGPAASR